MSNQDKSFDDEVVLVANFSILTTTTTQVDDRFLRNEHPHIVTLFLIRNYCSYLGKKSHIPLRQIGSLWVLQIHLQIHLKSVPKIIRLSAFSEIKVVAVLQTGDPLFLPQINLYVLCSINCSTQRMSKVVVSFLLFHPFRCFVTYLHSSS